MATAAPALGTRPDSRVFECIALGLFAAVVAALAAWAMAFLVLRPSIWTHDHAAAMPFAYSWSWFKASALAATTGGGDSNIRSEIWRLDAVPAVHWRTLAVLYASLAAAVVAMVRQASSLASGKSVTLLDGVELVTDPARARREANAKFFPLRLQHGNGIWLAPGIRVDWELPSRSINVYGATGGGKTQWLMYYISQILEAQQLGSNERIFIYDFKQEFYQKFPLPTDRIILLSPKDERSDGWAIGRDLETPYHMREFCEVLIKSVNEGQSGKDPKWSKGAAEIVTGAMVFMQKMRQENWSFIHVLQVLQSPPQSLRGIMEKVWPDALQYCILNADKSGWNDTGASYFTDVAAMCKVLRMLDDAWGHLPKSRLFSIRDWVSNDGKGKPGKGKPGDCDYVPPDCDYVPPETRTLILGGFPELEIINAAFSAAFLAVLTAKAKSLDDNPLRRVHLIVDEARQLIAGFGTSAESSMAVGRSKGLSMVLCWQSATQIQGALSDADSKSLVSITGTSVILKQNPGDGADFLIKQLLGRQRTAKQQWSKSMGPQTSYSVSEQTHEEECVMPTALTQDLAAGHWPDFGDGFRAIIVGAGRNPIRVHYDFSFSWPKRREKQILAAWTRAPKCLTQMERDKLMASIQGGIDRAAQPQPKPEPVAG